MIPVFLTTDNNYAPYLAAVIESMCENTTSSINFYIIDCGIEAASKDKITKLVSRHEGSTIEFIDPDGQNIFSECRARNQVSKAAYARLLIPHLKPQIEKAIYLDVDMIVNSDIAEIYKQNVNGYIIGAVYGDCIEYHDYDIITKKKLGIDLEHNYFSSGLLLIDCKKWRENNITQRLKNIYDEYNDRMVHNDQDLLNILFSNNKYFNLDKKFNYIIQYKSTEDRNVIYHYDGPVKPWQILPDLKTSIIKYIDIWWDYAKKTPFYEEILKTCDYKTKESLYDLRLQNIFVKKLRKNRCIKNKIHFIKKVLNIEYYNQMNLEKKINYLNVMIGSLLNSYNYVSNNKIYDLFRILLFIKYLKKKISHNIIYGACEYRRLPNVKKFLRIITGIDSINI